FSEIGRAQMGRRIDSKKLRGGGFKICARAEVAAEHGRARDHIRKLAADAHDFAHVVDANEIIPAVGKGVHIVRRNNQSFRTVLKSRTQDQSAITADRRVNKELREALRLRLRTNENPDSENDTD